MKNDACAERSFITKSEETRGNLFRSIGYFVAAVAISSILGGVAQAATIVDLNNAISNLNTVANAELSQGVEVMNAINVVLAPKQSLTVGTVGGSVAVDLPVYFRASTSAVSGIQFDVVLSTGMTVASVVPGIAAQAAGKSVQGNAVQTGYRVIIFGLNTTTIPTGPVAVLRVNLGANVGTRPIALVNTAASSPTGTNVPLTGRNGKVIIR